MSRKNIFMNTYQQPENKLTYNFLCLLEHMEECKEFCEFLLDSKLSLADNPITEIETVFSGGETNPDGMIRLQSQNKSVYSVYIENKTFRAALNESQLRNHIKIFCKDENSLLLVITPRITDKKIIDSINSNRILFKTWSEIVAKLKNLNMDLTIPSFIITQFIEYGKLSGEFEDMENITKEELNNYIETIKSNIEGKLKHIFERIATEINFNEYGLNVKGYEVTKHWGRLGAEFKFSPKNDYGQWFFYGIYFDSSDHGIKFKKDGIPELAFFFDVNPNYKEYLKNKNDLLDTLERLSQKGFEENLKKKITQNKWRFLFKRIPLTEIEDFSYESIKKTFIEILKQLNEEETFREELL